MKSRIPGVFFQAKYNILICHFIWSYLTVSNVWGPNPSNYKQTLLNIPKFGVDFFAVLKREISNASLFSSSLFCWITNNLLLSSLFLALLPPLTGDSDSLRWSPCDLNSWVTWGESYDSTYLKLITFFTKWQSFIFLSFIIFDLLSLVTQLNWNWHSLKITLGENNLLFNETQLTWN